MSYAAGNPVRCADDNCPAQHPSGVLGTMRATRAGWFHGTNGKAYCPKHVPEQAKTRRAR